MGNVLDVLRGMPGLVPEDAYDDDYPGSVAGHVAAGSRVDTAGDAVNTPFGVDHGFNGDDVDRNPGRHVESAGAEETDKLIREATKEAKSGNGRKPITEVATEARYLTNTFQQAGQLIIRRNANRKAVVVTCQSGGPCYIGADGSVGQATPSSVALPTGVGRTFTHRDTIYIWGSAGAVVDVVEEVF